MTETVEDWKRIHGCDQRSATVCFRHEALEAAEDDDDACRSVGCAQTRSSSDGGVVEVSQRGSGSKQFVANTSTVIWPICFVAAERFCDATLGYRRGGCGGTAAAKAGEREQSERRRLCELARELIVTRDTRVLELGAGLGMLGIVLSRLGAHVTLTDESLELLGDNVSASGSARARAAKLEWAIRDEGDEKWTSVEKFAKEYKSAHSGELPHLILGTDLLYSQTKRTFRALVHTMAELADEDATILIGYEDRGDWSQLATFFEFDEAVGLYGSAEPFSDDNEDLLLICLKKRSGPE